MVHLKYIFLRQEIYFIVRYLYVAVPTPLEIFTYLVYYQLLSTVCTVLHVRVQ